MYLVIEYLLKNDYKLSSLIVKKLPQQFLTFPIAFPTPFSVCKSGSERVKPIDDKKSPIFDWQGIFTEFDSHVTSHSARFRKFRGIDCMAANLRVPETYQRTESKKVKFGEDRIQLYFKDDAPLEISACTNTCKNNFKSRFSERKKISQSDVNPSEPHDSCMDPTLVYANWENIIVDSCFPQEVSELYHWKVDIILKRFAETHMNLSIFACQTTNRYFLELGIKLHNIKKQITEANCFAQGVASRIFLELVLGNEVDTNGILKLKKMQFNLSRDLLKTKQTFNSDLKQLCRAFSNTEHLKVHINHAYNKCGEYLSIYDTNNAQIDETFNKKLYDQSSILHQVLNRKSLRATFIHYMKKLSEGQEYLWKLEQILLKLQ